MIAITTDMREMPSCCDICQWYGSRPHPYKGWTNTCELMSHCMDDDQPDEWIYDGNGRPAACPLIEVPDIDRAEILRLCNEIEMIVCEIYNTGHMMQNCDYNAILNRLKAIGKELTGDVGSKTD